MQFLQKHVFSNKCMDKLIDDLIKKYLNA